ncbi:MAG: UDP-N-acetylmuramate--L-alanine ligase, partial [Bacteroidales bacterium]|nr:UDP-N-acetylmuramate--L-alanine ligase [Bacteroidales bacterium]
MDFKEIESVYFLGIGGIGMSALVRYFLFLGKKVAGYDRTETELTQQLSNEGAHIHYADDVEAIPCFCKNPANVLVVVTPAVPEDLSEYRFFQQQHFHMMKRAQALGEITRVHKSLCIAGTHGKTTTASMTAHLFKQSATDCNAFLGGILKNYDTNLLLSNRSDFTIVEADEYDRSFHSLLPYMAVITSADPDHLDIYKTEAAYYESFAHFTSLIKQDGALVMKKSIPVAPRVSPDIPIYMYSEKEGDFHAENICIGNGEIVFDFVTPGGKIEHIQLGVPVRINIENAVAAMALGWLNGIPADDMRCAMATFQGAKRRFDLRLRTEKLVLIDDYAHHPDELRASILSVRELYAGRKLTGIFQPHLYSRTRDFVGEFAASLSLLDELVLLDIYPARETPIPGVTSEIIFDKVTIQEKTLLKKEELLQYIENK